MSSQEHITDSNNVTDKPELSDSEIAEFIDSIRDSSSEYDRDYWDASAMAPLSPASVRALNRLRTYTPPPFPTWSSLPLTRRAAVLILLYASSTGSLRCVVTMRSSNMRSYSGHAAFPGGHADTLSETPYQIARREAYEEIGLPADDKKIPKPFRIEKLCEMPHSFAYTEIAVRPVVAFLHNDVKEDANQEKNEDNVPTVENSLIPRLDAKEVAAVFSAPFHNFLLCNDEIPPHLTTNAEKEKYKKSLPPGKWYEGEWINSERVNGGRWKMHNFYVPVNNQRVTKPRAKKSKDTTEMVEKLESIEKIEKIEDGDEKRGVLGRKEGEKDGVGEEGRYKVWGMTGRMVVDCARLAYGEEPEFEHNSHIGDEERIKFLYEQGRLPEKTRKQPDSQSAKAMGEKADSAKI